MLHNDKGKRMTEQGWKRLWQSYMCDLNIKYGHQGAVNKHDPAGVPMVIDTFTPHQLRHTFCTLMYFAGVDVMTARDQMGHKDISVTRNEQVACSNQVSSSNIKDPEKWLAA